MTRSASLCALLAVFLCLPPAAWAQETRGSIEGVVKDSSGAVLPGVTLEARTARGGTATAVSDDAGKYRFPALTPGRYTVTASMPGFKKAAFENVDLLLGQVLQVNFALEVGGISEDVQVTAESPIIDVKQNAAGASIQKEIIDLIPKGRNYTDAVKSAPGANPETRGGGIMIDGAGGSENRFVVDGLDTTALRNGVSSTSVVTDFVEQVQVKSSGYNAEFRATTGGVISAITRSGTNRYSGELGAYYRNNDWLGDIRQSIRLNPTNQTLSQYIITPRTEGSTVEPALTLGGPILRDRMWFFAGYVPQFSRSERTVTFTQNRAAGPQTFTSESEDHNITYNVSSQVTPRFRTKFSGSNQPTKGGVGLPGVEPDFIDGARVDDLAFRTSTANPTTFPGVLYTNNFTNSYRLINDWVVSPKLYVNVTGGFLKYGSEGQTLTEFNTNTRRTFSASNTCNPAAVPGSSACPFPDIPASLQQPNGYADGISNSRTVRDDYSRIGASIDGTYYATWMGQHTFKGGFQYERLGNDVLSGQQAPNIALSWNASRTTIDVPARIVRGPYGFYTVSRQYTEGAIHSNNYGLFFQDAWTVNNNLTLNLGLRADQEDIPSYRPENPGIHFSFAEKLAPRVGFAYDVKGDGKWKAYGSWGMFYDISKLEMPRGSFGADRWISYYWTLEDPNWPAIDCTGEPNSGCPGTFIEQVDFRHVSNGVGSEQLVDPDLKPIRAQEFTLGAEHQLARSMSISVRYAHKWMDRTIEDVGIAVPGVGEVFYITNPGEGLSENLLRDQGGCATCPNQPKPERVYDGLEFRLMKRLSNNWYANASYTWSRLHGNYSGLSSSDENGRNSPSVNRFFDGQYMSFDQTGQPIYGDLGTDRPHQFELQAAYQFPWGTQVGGYYLIGSGLPQQQQVTIQGVPVFNLGRNSMGRTPTFSQTDLNIMQDVRLFGGTRVTLEMNIDNVFDQDIVTAVINTPYRDAIPVSPAAFFAGFDADAIAAATPSIRRDPRFGLASGFQGAREIRVAAKFRF
jgi:outer membrane receptor protein involved in Fe transport